MCLNNSKFQFSRHLENQHSTSTANKAAVLAILIETAYGSNLSCRVVNKCNFHSMLQTNNISCTQLITDGEVTTMKVCSVAKVNILGYIVLVYIPSLMRLNFTFSIRSLYVLIGSIWKYSTAGLCVSMTQCLVQKGSMAATSVVAAYYVNNKQ